jgi:hypothetical protein
MIIESYANADRVQELWESQASEEHHQASKANLNPKNPLTASPKGDMVFENASLFLRDALLSQLFLDAVKAGDSGLVLSYGHWHTGVMED